MRPPVSFLRFLCFCLVLSVFAVPPAFAQSAVIGEAAPAFTLTDTNGETHQLSDFEGQFVVLEWTNYDCPFVARYLEAGTLQTLQADYTDRDVVWLSVVSSAPGREGHYPGEVMNARAENEGVAPTAILLDESGEVGRAYGATNTPHLYVIDPEGILRYNGTLDNDRRGDLQGTDSYIAYAEPALDAVLAGEAVAVSKTPPFGCPIWYSDVVDPRQ